MVMQSYSESKYLPPQQFMSVDNVTDPDNTIIGYGSGQYVGARTSLNVFKPGTTTGDKETPNDHGFIREHYTFGAKVTRERWYMGFPRVGTYIDTSLVSYGAAPIASMFSSSPIVPNGWDALNWDSLKDSCMEKIYEQIKGNNNLAVDWAERAPTVKMLKSALQLKKNIIKFMSDLARDSAYQRVKRTRSKKRAHDFIAGKWLEYRYGWLPFMNSIYDAADNLRRDTSKRRVYVKGRSSKSYRGLNVTGTGFYSQPRGSVQYSGQYRTEIGCWFDLPGGFQVTDWTSLNPAGIAWELLTLSFVVDWFANIGQQLELAENHVIFSSHFGGGYITECIKETRIGYYSGSSEFPPLGYWENGNPFKGIAHASVSGSAFGQFTTKNRSKLFALPRPAGFQLRTNLNANRVVDAAAICSGMLRKFLK